MYNRLHHHVLAMALQSLDADLLARNRCLLGGGTAITLRYGEYRESVDIDFLVSDLWGYRNLHQLIKEADSLKAIAKAGAVINELREIRSTGYSIQSAIGVGDARIKFEIVLEARIKFDSPESDDRVCGIATLTPTDLMASKLLANVDRWRDDAFFSRDLIDMAMMQSPKLLPMAIAKAESAYGGSVRRDLAKAVEHVLKQPGWLEKCLEAMKMDTPKAVLWKHIKALAAASKPQSVPLI
ncbi:nucleotidyl transferase AbiEii/AbiGii toxin family protein [Propionivibrio sp.]|uniref:nucleotidyl transferase AbiEii/AbiGii toxin family protein n=1 Tax=Propionivibrio sp. TaxID=2212460 RepID=UPI00262E4B1F|nr:nucleotidyl transferase AbiEii/AbiGii toxin family protein [Propionivibrio sp.]